MNFIFMSRRSLPALVLAAACALTGCAREQAPAPLPVAADGGDAQRLAALVDYVGGDYGRAVQAGVIASQAEYDEQVRFVADARRLAAGLIGSAADEKDPLLALLAKIESLVLSIAEPEAVTRACGAAREAIVARFRLPTVPAARPILTRAQALYAENCAVCHGLQGDAATERAKELDPPPASFREASRLDMLSPYRVYNALTFGVPGTAMAAFETLSPAERWDVAFYVFRLGHEGRQAQGPSMLALADLASRSDRELRDALGAEAHPDPAAGVVHARREAAFAEPTLGEGLASTRRLVRESGAAFAAGREREADRLAIDAYLLGFEPLEPRLRARDDAATGNVEKAFADLRAAMARGDKGEARSRGARLEALLSNMGAGQRGSSVPFWAAALIYFREGIEAALLVAALLAALRKLGRTDASRFVHIGWVAALPAGVATWWVFRSLLSFGADRRELLESVVALLAAAVLFSVSFWMISRAESQHWMAYLKRNVEQSLGRRNLFVLSGVAFLAVYREAAEVILFTQALFLDAGNARGQVWAGAAAGVVAVLGVALAMSRAIFRLPLGPFFAVSSALLCGLAISFAGSGMHKLVATGYLSPRPVSFPEVAWMGIHPDLSGLLLQLTIVAIIAAAGLATRRRPAVETPGKGR
jgi:high-affinity iron transporter